MHSGYQFCSVHRDRGRQIGATRMPPRGKYLVHHWDRNVAAQGVFRLALSRQVFDFVVKPLSAFLHCAQVELPHFSKKDQVSFLQAVVVTLTALPRSLEVRVVALGMH